MRRFSDLKDWEVLQLLLDFFMIEENVDAFERFLQNQKIEMVDFAQLEERLEMVRDDLPQIQQ